MQASESCSRIATKARGAARRWMAAAGLAAVLAAVSCGGSPVEPGPPATAPPVPLPIPDDVAPVVRTILEGLPQHIAAMVERLRLILPLNPQSAPQIHAKIALLERPTLFNEIIGGRLWHDRTVSSMTGASVPVGQVFPLPSMRGEALDALTTLERGFPVLESFMQTPFPTSTVRMWYGFKVGSSAGGGLMEMEDRTTYHSRPNTSLLPYESIVHHELAHSYVGNETLTQFLELYVYNVLQTGSRDLAVWPHTRNYVPMQESNADIAAVLDVYTLIGPDGMSAAYRALYPLRPPSARPLDPAVIQAFVDQAPEGARALVEDKMKRVSF